MIQGIDVSFYQGVVDFNALPDWVEFVIVKATEGIHTTDDQYARNLAEARRTGRLILHYHLSHFDVAGRDPQTEANWFLQNSNVLPGEGIVLDAEVGGGGQGDACLNWWIAVKNRLPDRGGFFYSFLNWIQNQNFPVGITGMKLWLAWPDSNGNMPSPGPWPGVSMQQYGSPSGVSGISGAVDVNRFFGTREQLKRILAGGTMATLYNQLAMPEDHLGTCANISRRLYGCWITSIAMMVSDYGHPILPEQLDNQFTARGLYVNGCDGTDVAITSIYPDVQLAGRWNYGGSAADLSKLSTLPGEAVILQLDGIALGLGYPTHYVYLVAWDGNTVTVHNPWGGIVNNWDVPTAARFITAIIKYVQPKAPPPAPPPPPPISLGGSMILFHPTDTARMDQVVIGLGGGFFWRSAMYGTSALSNAGWTYIQAPVPFAPMTASAAWKASGDYIAFEAIGTDGKIWSCLLHADGSVYNDWTANEGTAALPAAGQPGPPGPVYDDADLKRRINDLEALVKRLRADLGQ